MSAAATASDAATTTLTVAQFPCRSDNYGYLVHDAATGQTAAIDTPDAREISRQLRQHGWTLTHIWNTHHHDDHAGGNKALQQEFPEMVVYGPATEHIPCRTHAVDDGDEFTFGNQVPIKVLNVGGHTKGHIAFWIPSQNMAFVGDALFALGCGRMFEGTPQQFWTSLLKLRALPDDTTIYCAHEYTQANARFALSVEPSNAKLVERAERIQQLRAQNQPTVPSLLGEEKETNPFLRCDFSEEIQKKVGVVNKDDAFEAFAKTRAAKDNFRG